LQAKLDEVTTRERANAIADIRQKMQEYGIELSELGTTRKTAKTKSAVSKRGRATKGAVRARKSARAKKSASAMREVRYRDPDSGATWSGRGRVPRWIAGREREQFAVTH
jgi:DNA-binding protein H-NS